MRFPLDAGTYELSDPFGWRTHPITGNRAHHNGVDFAAASGTPIRAIVDGRIGRAGTSSGAGNWVELHEDNGRIWDHFHMLRPTHLAIGTRVDEGDTIGYVGTSGASTGPHLHLELYPATGAARIDPYPVLVAGTTPPPRRDFPTMILYQITDPSAEGAIYLLRADGAHFHIPRISTVENLMAGGVRIVRIAWGDYLDVRNAVRLAA